MLLFYLRCSCKQKLYNWKYPCSKKKEIPSRLNKILLLLLLYWWWEEMNLISTSPLLFYLFIYLMWFVDTFSLTLLQYGSRSLLNFFSLIKPHKKWFQANEIDLDVFQPTSSNRTLFIFKLNLNEKELKEPRKDGQSGIWTTPWLIIIIFSNNLMTEII